MSDVLDDYDEEEVAAERSRRRQSLFDLIAKIIAQDIITKAKATARDQAKNPALDREGDDQ